MQQPYQRSGDIMNDLPRVLLENYMMLSAAVENQNLGRLQDMLQYQHKVHQNLIDIVQHIEEAPAVAMTTSQQNSQTGPQHQQPEETHDQGQEVPVIAGQAAAAFPVRHPHQQTQQQQQSQQSQQQQQQEGGQPPWLSSVNQPVHQLLQQLGLSQFVPLLEQQHVDLAALQLMEERHMRELGLPIGAVVKIKAALDIRKQNA